MKLVDNRDYIIQLIYGEQELYLAKYCGSMPSCCWSRKLEEALRFCHLDALDVGDQLLMDGKPMSVVAFNKACRERKGSHGITAG